MGRLERILLGVTTLVAGGSGLAVGFIKHCLTPSEPFSVVNHPWQPSLLSLHVIAAPILLFAIGWIAKEHILGKMLDPRARRGRRTGLATAAIVVPMAASGIILQVLTSQGARSGVGWAHLATGLAFLLLVAAHAWLGSRATPPKARNSANGAKGRGRRRGLKQRGIVL